MGHVRLVEPSAFSRISALGVEEQRVNVVIDLDEPRERWEALGDGYRVETRIVVFRAEDVVTVPASALFRHDGGWAVFRTTSEDLAERVVVEVGRRNGLAAEVVSGLEPGDRVVVHPSDLLDDGSKIAVR
jgi:HlyD family secretion protein